MPKSRKRKNKKSLTQVAPRQALVQVGEDKEGKPVYAKVKTNRNKVIKHRPQKS